ncbi:MAG TPA: hypothetical protein VJY35_10610 [Candidatus Eisenbacteria bacterium]|nr:hypothetical protein [Candidatus Eisenbacteria bacterium]
MSPSTAALVAAAVLCATIMPPAALFLLAFVVLVVGDTISIVRRETKQRVDAGR